MKQRPHGFTLLELMVVVAVIAILGAISVVSYQEYTMRARAADILVKYDAIKSVVGAQLATQQGVDDCARLAGSLSTANLADPYATLAYGFEAANGGYRPVLTVCAKADPNNPVNAKVAKGAHDTMAKINGVEPGAVLTDSLVSFALPLTSGNAAVCKTAAPASVTPCGTRPAAVSAAVTPTQCPAGQELVASAQGPQTCVPMCGPDQKRAPGGACVSTQKPALASIINGLQAPTATPSHCPAGQEWATVAGTSQPACVPVCAQGQKRDPAGQCVTEQQPTNTVPPTAATMTHAQCASDCRVRLCPHGNCNSHAVQTCIHACPR